jgi:hypothetical protein
MDKNYDFDVRFAYVIAGSQRQPGEYLFTINDDQWINHVSEEREFDIALNYLTLSHTLEELRGPNGEPNPLFKRITVQLKLVGTFRGKTRYAENRIWNKVNKTNESFLFWPIQKRSLCERQIEMIIPKKDF